MLNGGPTLQLYRSGLATIPVGNLLLCPQLSVRVSSCDQMEPLKTEEGVEIDGNASATIEAMPPQQAVAVQTSPKQQEQQHIGQFDRAPPQNAEDLQQLSLTDVHINVVDLTAYSKVGSSATHSPPSTSYVKQPATPRDLPEGGWGEFCGFLGWCLVCGPIGGCIYLLRMPEHKK